MKKRCFLLVFVLLLFTSAWAEFSSAPYTYPSIAQPLGGDEMLLYQEDQPFAHAEILRSNQRVLSFDLPTEDGSTYAPIVRPSGEVAFLCRSPGPRSSLITVDRQARTAVQLDLYPVMSHLHPLGEGFAGTVEGEAEDRLFLLDGSMTRQLLLPLDQPRLLLRQCALLPDGNSLFLLQMGEERYGSGKLCLLKLSAEGNVLFSCDIADEAPSTGATLTPLADGHVLVAYDDQKDFSLTHIVFVRPDGTKGAQHRLSGAPLVISFQASETTPNGAALYGYAVANSRGLFDAIRVEISPAGSLLSVMAKDFSCEQDYAFWVRKAPDGRFFVFSNKEANGRGEHGRVVVPFDALPDIEAPALRLE